MLNNPKLAEANDFMDLHDLVNSKSWRKFIDIQRERKEELQERANSFIRQKEWFDAFATVSRIDDIKKMIRVVEQKLLTLTKERGKQ